VTRRQRARVGALLKHAYGPRVSVEVQRPCKALWIPCRNSMNGTIRAAAAGMSGDEPAQGEDCLVLNVWTAGTDQQRKRPVLVWVHGGAFSTGSGSWPLYDGASLASLASRGDAVVVTINHRLGPLGYLHLAGLTGDERYRDSGNAGMLDIVLALRWVRDNIAAFGGDPGHVMVFGAAGPEFARAYRAEQPGAAPTELACSFVTDRVMWWGAIDWAQRKVAAGGALVYVYRFDFASAALGGIFGAMHGGEIPFVFDSYWLTPVAGDRPENAQVARVMSEAFVRFAAGGDPNHPELPSWSPYTLEQRATMVFDAASHAEDDPRPAIRELYAKFYATS
jgi:carboxylesterase type B